MPRLPGIVPASRSSSSRTSITVTPGGDQLLELVDVDRVRALVAAAEHVAGDVEERDRVEAADRALGLLEGLREDAHRPAGVEHEARLRGEARSRDRHVDGARPMTGEVERHGSHVEQLRARGRRRELEGDGRGADERAAVGLDDAGRGSAASAR